MFTFVSPSFSALTREKNIGKISAKSFRLRRSSIIRVATTSLSESSTRSSLNCLSRNACGHNSDPFPVLPHPISRCNNATRLHRHPLPPFAGVEGASSRGTTALAVDRGVVRDSRARCLIIGDGAMGMQFAVSAVGRWILKRVLDRAWYPHGIHL